MTSLLVTNDFPPKVGGIQSYLGELWRRLPPSETTVLTAASAADADAFDAAQPYRVERVARPFLLPTPALARRSDALAREVGADVVLLDPLTLVGPVGRSLRGRAPHVIVVHGAEVTMPGRVPPSSLVCRAVLRRAEGIVAAGGYPADVAARVAGRPLPTLRVPPGVDVDRFAPQTDDARAATRRRFGLDPDRPLVLGVSRLVPRKGFDVLVDALGRLDPSVQLAIVGSGRDRGRLEARAATRGVGAQVHFLGRVAGADLPALYASADVFSMLCRDRWLGLEAEGFGIVFLEAAACGVPSVAGRSGGSHEAVVDGETGAVVDPRSAAEAAAALDRLLTDDARRARFGAAARARAVADFAYDALAARLLPLTRGDLSVLTP